MKIHCAIYEHDEVCLSIKRKFLDFEATQEPPGTALRHNAFRHVQVPHVKQPFFIAMSVAMECHFADRLIVITSKDGQRPCSKIAHSKKKRGWGVGESDIKWWNSSTIFTAWI